LAVLWYTTALHLGRPPDLPGGVIYEGVDAYVGKPQQFRGETGAQSAIVPSLDAALGVGHQEDVLRVYLMEMRTYMPPDRRDFIASLEARGSVRNFMQHGNRRSLTAIYNASAEEVERFRSPHLEYGARYIFHQA
jgi:indoleamine 2,3-dioxygenase